MESTDKIAVNTATPTERLKGLLSSHTSTDSGGGIADAMIAIMNNDGIANTGLASRSAIALIHWFFGLSTIEIAVKVPRFVKIPRLQTSR